MKATYVEKISNIIEKQKVENPIKELHFIIDIEPLPYARPRTSCKLKQNQVYDPRSGYKNKIKKIVKECINKNNPNFELINGDVKIEIDFYLETPKNISNSKTKMDLVKAKFLRPLTRPDLDNYLKPIFDAMNGIIYKDDGQITSITTNKLYTYDNSPKIDVRIYYMQDKIKLR